MKNNAIILCFGILLGVLAFGLSNHEREEIAIESVVPEVVVETETGGSEEDIIIPDMTFSFPIAAEDWKITSPFGVRVSPIYHVLRKHTGVDISIDDDRRGMPQIVAVAAGVIEEHFISDPMKGKHIIIDHGNGLETGYLHLSESFIHEYREDGTRWTVKAGEPIGRMGDTGWCDGAHLHFYMKIDGEFVNPMIYLERVFPEWSESVTIGLTSENDPALNRENNFKE